MEKNRSLQPGINTLSVWAGEENKDLWHGATQVPVTHSVSFGYQDMDYWYEVALQRQPGHIYGRNTNPTVAAFEEKVRQLEGTAAATSFATGMAAISNSVQPGRGNIKNGARARISSGSMRETKYVMRDM